MMTIPFECWVCGAVVSHDLSKSPMPTGWKEKPIAGGVHILCDTCAPHSALRDAMAGQLRAMIKARHGIDLDDTGAPAG